MMYPLISVVVPVFNCENFLSRCLDSLLAQTYPNLEIILVNDGSRDSSGDLCDKYAKKYSIIKVLHRENSGQAASRNIGVKISRGEYIAFVDADDWVNTDLYSTLYENAVKAKAQISCCGIDRVRENRHISFFNKNTEDYLFYNSGQALEALLDNVIITNSPCDKLFKKSIIINRPMVENMIFEDFEIMPKWLEKASRIVYTGKPMYYYRMNPFSTMSTVTKKRFDEVKASESRVDFYATHCKKILKRVKARHMEICLNVLSCTLPSVDCCKERKDLSRRIKDSMDLEIFMSLSTISMIKYILLIIGLPFFDKIANLSRSKSHE